MFHYSAAPSHFCQLECQAFKLLHPTFNNLSHKNLLSQKVLYLSQHLLYGLTMPSFFFFLFGGRHLSRSRSSIFAIGIKYQVFFNQIYFIRYILSSRYRGVLNNVWLQMKIKVHIMKTKCVMFWGGNLKLCIWF